MKKTIAEAWTKSKDKNPSDGLKFDWKINWMIIR